MLSNSSSAISGYFNQIIHSHQMHLQFPGGIKMSFSTNYDEKEKLWRGPEIVSLCDANTSLSELLMKALSTYGSKTAQVRVSAHGVFKRSLVKILYSLLLHRFGTTLVFE